MLDRLRAEADAYKTSRHERKGTVLINSGDSILAGLNLRASFQRFDTAGQPFYDSLVMELVGFDAATIGNHEYDFGPEASAQLHPRRRAGRSRSSRRQHRHAPRAVAGRPGGLGARSRPERSRWRAGPEAIGVVGAITPTRPSSRPPGNVQIRPDVAGDVSAQATPDHRGRASTRIIVVLHLQDVASEIARSSAQLQDVDIVIAGGGDDLLSNSGDVLIPGTCTPARPVSAARARQHGRDVPVSPPPGDYRYVGRLG